MKKSQFGFFKFIGTEKDKAKANLIFSIVIAFFTSLGIGYKFDAVAGTLLITNLTPAALLHGLSHWTIQWVSQHVAYKTWIVPQELQAANIDVLNQLLDHLKGELTPVSVENVNPSLKP